MNARRGTPSNPEHPNTTAVEPKVQWQAVVHYVASLLLLALYGAITDSTLLVDTLPYWAEIFVLPLIPTIGGLITGYAARHQWRTNEVRAHPGTTR